jgi:predicted ATPase
MRSVPEALDAVGHVFARTYHLTALSEAYGKAGRFGEAMAEIAKAIAQVEKTGEGFYEPEIHRVQGELLEMQGHNEEAESAYHQAIAIAQRSQAKVWELRATTSLAQLLQKQGKGKEARRKLAKVYDWFTEGFDTPDLKDAKALLEELS